MSQPANSEITDWKARQDAGRCAAKRCPRYAVPGGNYCGQCGPKKRARDRRALQRRRAELEAQGLCLGDCGRKRKAGRKRCPQCLTAQSRRVGGRADRVGGQRAIPTPRRGHYKTEVYADGAERTRYVGQAHRGGPTRQEQDQSAANLARNAEGLAKAWCDERIERQAEIDELPRIQRAARRKLFASRLTYAGRLLIQAAAEYGDDEARGLLKVLCPDE